MVSFISFVFAATINKLPLTKRERGFISAFLPTAAPADKGLCRYGLMTKKFLTAFLFQSVSHDLSCRVRKNSGAVYCT